MGPQNDLVTLEACITSYSRVLKKWLWRDHDSYIRWQDMGHSPYQIMYPRTGANANTELCRFPVPQDGLVPRGKLKRYRRKLMF